LAMHRFTVSDSIHQRSVTGLVVLLFSLNWIFPEIAIVTGLDVQTENWFLTKVHADSRPPPPRTLVLRGPSPETERFAAFFAALGSFDVFVAPLADTWARTGEKVDLDDTVSCRSAAKALSVDSAKLECLHRAPPQPLPGCSLGIDFRGPPDVAGVPQRASIYAILENGEPCPFYDSLIPLSSYPFPGKPFRPWAGSRPVAEVVSPTAQSILRAIGVETGGHDR
jgi:hypothetical protein